MKSFLLTLALALSFNVFAADKGINIDVSLSPAGSFQVKTDKVKGKLKEKKGMYQADRLYVKVKDLKTGIELRDDHMKKRILTKDPKSKKITVSKVKAKGGRGVGLIEIKGIKKKIKFTYKTSGKVMTASFKLNLDDFKIKDLKYMGVGAKNIVDVVANIPIK